MKSQILQTGFLLGMIAVFAITGRSSLVLNELYVDPGGIGTPDTNKEFVEIIATSPSDSLSGVWLLEIEGEGTTAIGLVDSARDLSSLSLVNGLLTLGHGYGSASNPWGLTTASTGLGDLQRSGASFMENGGITFLLVTGFTGAVGNDIDANNDGVIDNPLWTSILDSVSSRDSALGTDVVHGPDLVTLGGFTSLDAFARVNGNHTPNSANAWYGGQVDEFDVFTTSAFNLPSGATGPTPGAPNFPVVPEPSSIALLSLGAVALRFRHRSQSASLA